jgi:CRP/FNR family cyclic AMP-dependent transcriptional regulator
VPAHGGVGRGQGRSHNGDIPTAHRRSIRDRSLHRSTHVTHPIADQIDGLAFFRNFTYRELETLARYLKPFSARQGDVLFNEGDAGNHMLVLIEGRISILKTGDHGRHLLSLEGKGRVVGEMALLDHERRSATCIADADCELVTIDHEALEKLAREHPLLAYRFTLALAQLLSRRLRKTSGVLAEHLGE